MTIVRKNRLVHVWTLKGNASRLVCLFLEYCPFFSPHNLTPYVAIMMTESSDSLELKILEASEEEVVLRSKKRWNSCCWMLTIFVILVILLVVSVVFIALYVVERKSFSSERQNVSWVHSDTRSSVRPTSPSSSVVGITNSLCLTPSCVGVAHGEFKLWFWRLHHSRV